MDRFAAESEGEGVGSVGKRNERKENDWEEREKKRGKGKRYEEELVTPFGWLKHSSHH